MLTIKEIESKVRWILKENTETETNIEQIGLEESLDVLGVNSISFIKIIVTIETEFDLEFEDDELDFNRFKTLKSMVENIQIKLKQ